MLRPTRKELARWEKVLAKHGLGMNAGIHRFRVGKKRPYRIAYVGAANNIEDIYEMQVGDNGRVKPPGAGPD